MKYLDIKRLENTLLITIDRQEKLNALNAGVLDELSDAFNTCREDKQIRAVVIAGAGEKSFVAGADIKEMSTFNATDATFYSEKGLNLFNKSGILILLVSNIKLTVFFPIRLRRLSFVSLLRIFPSLIIVM